MCLNNDVMKTKVSNNYSIKKYLDLNPDLHLLFGISLMWLSHLNFNVPLLAWACMVPFLIYLKLSSSKYKLLKFTLSLLIAWSLIVLKIITDPIPVYLVPMYSVPITLIHLPGYLVWMKSGNQKWASFLFPATMIVLEWIQYTFTPLGSWGSIGYSQVGEHIVLQTLSLVGLGGLGFVIYTVNVLGASWWLGNKNVYRTLRHIVPIVIGLVIYGSLRVGLFESQSQKMVKVAAVGTESVAGGLPLPSQEKNLSDFNVLFERTKKAAEMGSEMVVWNEAAFITEPSYEPLWLDSMTQLADKYDLTLFASYVNVVSLDPFKFENKYRLINADGELLMTYLKHEPVPGEPAIRGKEEIEVYNRNGLNIGGAICYDFDFPYLARAFRKAGADIIGLPSSDWRGIDPLHTEMASFRAIEQGYSILRSTRFGLSAAIDPIGKTNAKMSSNDTNDKVMVAELPVTSIKTLYSLIGDSVVYLAMIYLMLYAFRVKRARYS